MATMIYFFFFVKKSENYQQFLLKKSVLSGAMIFKWKHDVGTY